MNTYTVTVKPNFNAFAAIMRFDPEVLIELEDSDEAVETYTITSECVLDSLLDAAPAGRPGRPAGRRRVAPVISRVASQPATTRSRAFFVVARFPIW